MPRISKVEFIVIVLERNHPAGVRCGIVWQSQRLPNPANNYQIANIDISALKLRGRTTATRCVPIHTSSTNRAVWLREQQISI